MLKTRVSASIVVRDNLAVQSFGFQSYLPIGNPVICAKNYDRWGADEILVTDINASVSQQGPNIELVTNVGSATLSTPFVYAGGLSSPQDVSRVLALGFERVVITASFLDNPQSVVDIAALVGAQAVIIGLPVIYDSNTFYVYDYRHKSYHPFPGDKLNQLFDQGAFSELLLFAVASDGQSGYFSLPLHNLPLSKNIPLLLHGGLDTSTIIQTSSNRSVSAYFLSNPLLYKEHFIQSIKRHLDPDSFRSPYFSSSPSF